MALWRLFASSVWIVDVVNVFCVWETWCTLAAKWLLMAMIASPRMVCSSSASSWSLVYTPSGSGSWTPCLIMCDTLKVWGTGPECGLPWMSKNVHLGLSGVPKLKPGGVTVLQGRGVKWEDTRWDVGFMNMCLPSSSSTGSSCAQMLVAVLTRPQTGRQWKRYTTSPLRTGRVGWPRTSKTRPSDSALMPWSLEMRC